jgi:hypothetical protein
VGSVSFSSMKCVALQAIRNELARRRKVGERIIRDRLKRFQVEGDFPEDSDPADLARYLSIVIYGITIQASGGATRKELRSVVDLALGKLAASKRAQVVPQSETDRHDSARPEFPAD